MKHKSPLTMWGIRLESDAATFLEKNSCKECVLHNWTHGLPDHDALEAQKPNIMWISQKGWDIIRALPQEQIRFLDIVPRILLLEENASPDSLQQAIDAGFNDILKAPFSKARVREVFLHAAEVQTLYGDIMRMTQEIFLERELLARKNDILEFIITFLSRATESLNISEVLHKVREDLGILLPLKGLHAALWRSQPGVSSKAEIFLSADKQSPGGREWTQLLLDSAAKLNGIPVANYTIALLPGNTDNSQPTPNSVILLPLKIGEESLGCLALSIEERHQLGKDQLQVLYSAMQHLALAVKNAMMYNDIRTQADRDGLTQLHNRRHFDKKIQEELTRHTRYGLDLTLLMIDIDHFKQINDHYGHQAGDRVLCDVANILHKTIRSTDYCARYGGEEFTVILPHTNEHQAFKLAERLREKIACAVSHYQDQEIHITISAGLSTFSSDAPISQDELLKGADAAMYLAKNNGRNMVCTFDNICLEEAKIA